MVHRNEVIKNLHVVFTMNPSSEGLKDRAATSPALFNRCVLNWMGDWSLDALHQVAKEFTNSIDLESASSSSSNPQRSRIGHRNFRFCSSNFATSEFGRERRSFSPDSDVHDEMLKISVVFDTFQRCSSD